MKVVSGVLLISGRAVLVLKLLQLARLSYFQRCRLQEKVIELVGPWVVTFNSRVLCVT